jgi:hypothetical protein
MHTNICDVAMMPGRNLTMFRRDLLVQFSAQVLKTSNYSLATCSNVLEGISFYIIQLLIFQAKDRMRSKDILQGLH